MPDNGFQVIPLRAFTDNYVWTLRNAVCAAVVDPGEARPVLDYLAAEKLLLVAILATHHHQDHVGGIAEILETHAVPVYGPRGEPITTQCLRHDPGDDGWQGSRPARSEEHTSEHQSHHDIV